MNTMYTAEGNRNFEGKTLCESQRVMAPNDAREDSSATTPKKMATSEWALAMRKAFSPQAMLLPDGSIDQRFGAIPTPAVCVHSCTMANGVLMGIVWCVPCQVLCVTR